ncbi:MAG: DUF5723 family protein, partial [Flavobacteriales bacterium]|nr:DUF5723 family protein [Flavobacteriales bacterium]
LYNGQNFRLIDLNSFSMTTHTDGRSVDLDLEYESLRSDTSAGDFGQSSGLGFGLDLFVSEQISLFQGSTGGSFVAELRDFGYLFWNDKTISEKLDTTHLDFQGFEIEDIFSFEDSSNTNDVDSLFIVRKEGKNKIKTVLPGNLLIAVNQSFGNHQLGIRFSQRIVANHLAHVGLRYGYWIGERFQPYVNVGYGGYGKMNFGIGFTLDLGNFALYVNTTNLEGQILKDYSGGNSGYIGIKGRF